MLYSTMIIDHLRKTAGDKTGIAFAFLERNHSQLNTAVDVLGSLWRQLLDSGAPPPDAAIDLFNDHYSKGSRPSIEEISNLLSHQLTSRPKNFIIIDGLDEYADDNNNPAALVKKISAFRDHAHILFTVTAKEASRLLDPGCAVFDLEVAQQDVRSFVEDSLAHIAEQQSWDWDWDRAIGRASELAGKE